MLSRQSPRSAEAVPVSLRPDPRGASPHRRRRAGGRRRGLPLDGGSQLQRQTGAPVWRRRAEEQVDPDGGPLHHRRRTVSGGDVERGGEGDRACGGRIVLCMAYDGLCRPA